MTSHTIYNYHNIFEPSWYKIQKHETILLTRKGNYPVTQLIIIINYDIQYNYVNPIKTYRDEVRLWLGSYHIFFITPLWNEIDDEVTAWFVVLVILLQKEAITCQGIQEIRTRGIHTQCTTHSHPNHANHIW